VSSNTNGLGNKEKTFQGQRLDNDLGLNWYTFKYRNYDASLARFHNIDPLAEDFVYNGTYNFSENRVLDAIELEGLEAFLIHGTNSDPGRWTENDRTIPTLLKLTNNQSVDPNFSWEELDYTTNSGAERNKAAQMLAEYVMDNRIDAEEITLIGHSHGGNVALSAARLIYEYTGEQVNIVTIATPTTKATVSTEHPGSTNKKYPKVASTLEAINDHIHLWNSIDGVQGGAAGGETYQNAPKTRQYEIDVSDEYDWYDLIPAHSFDVNNPETIEREIDNGRIEPLKEVKR